MLRSKYFWIAMAILVPFIIVWVKEGFGWAIITLVIMSLVFLFVLLAGRSSRRRRYYYDDEEEEEVYITRRRTPQRSDIQRGLDWHVPKVNKDGVEFITGAKGLQKTQRDAMRRTKKKLWG
jgi:uncharacterized membrane protein YqaE (UPF0057 family)